MPDLKPEQSSLRVPTVSIIIPAYETAQYIGEALDSVLAQSYTDYEVIVVNDGSPDTDELERVLEPYRERIVYIKRPNGGSSAARNTALRAARGRLVALLDSDDYWEPEYLATHVDILQRQPDVDVVFPNARVFGESRNAGINYMDLLPVTGDVTFWRVLLGECYIWYGVTARREVIEDAGMFDEDLGTAEDLDLWLRILHQGGRFTYHRRVLAHYRQREGSHSSDPVKLQRNYVVLLEKIRRTVPLSQQEQARFDQHYHGNVARLHLSEGKKALREGDVQEAIHKVGAANGQLRSRKLAAVILLMRAAPSLLRRVLQWRERLAG